MNYKLELLMIYVNIHFLFKNITILNNVLFDLLNKILIKSNNNNNQK
jgi:hypothetical protein